MNESCEIGFGILVVYGAVTFFGDRVLYGRYLWFTQRDMPKSIGLISVSFDDHRAIFHDAKVIFRENSHTIVVTELSYAQEGS